MMFRLRKRNSNEILQMDVNSALIANFRLEKFRLYTESVYFNFQNTTEN